LNNVFKIQAADGKRIYFF